MIYFKNLKGLSASIESTALVSKSALELIDQYVQSGAAPEALGELVSLLRALPCSNHMIRKESGFRRENDIPNDVQTWGKHEFAFVSAYGVCLPGIFKSNTKMENIGGLEHLKPSAESLGWTQIDRIAKLAKELKGELDFLRVSVPQEQISKVQKALKKNDTYSIMENTPESMLSSEAYAIYMVDQKGFANDKGNPVPIGGARLFESSSAAQRTINSRGWQKVVVVRAHIKIEGVDFTQKRLPDDFGDLAVALAHKDAKDLRQSTATVDEPQSSIRRHRL